MVWYVKCEHHPRLCKTNIGILRHFMTMFSISAGSANVYDHITLLNCHTVTLSHRHTVTLSHWGRRDHSKAVRETLNFGPNSVSYKSAKYWLKYKVAFDCKNKHWSLNSPDSWHPDRSDYLFFYKIKAIYEHQRNSQNAQGHYNVSLNLLKPGSI